MSRSGAGTPLRGTDSPRREGGAGAGDGVEDGDPMTEGTPLAAHGVLVSVLAAKRDPRSGKTLPSPTYSIPNVRYCDLSSLCGRR